jgi:hypothetical protein
MPFDANLVLVDGSYDWSYANLVTNGYGAPTSTTRTGGFAVIDLLALSSSPAKGLSCIFIADQAGAAADDALTLRLQGCDYTTFNTDDGPVHTLATFDVGGVTAGVILGNETPCTVIRRFSTTLRYLRAYATCVAGDNFYTCYVMLAYHPFNVL